MKRHFLMMICSFLWHQSSFYRALQVVFVPEQHYVDLANEILSLSLGLYSSWLARIVNLNDYNLPCKHSSSLAGTCNRPEKYHYRNLDGSSRTCCQLTLSHLLYRTSRPKLVRSRETTSKLTSLLLSPSSKNYKKKRGKRTKTMKQQHQRWP